jgi:hypothetical protein
MKKSDPKKNLPEPRGKIKILYIIRVYLTVIRILHRNLGAPRIIAAYLFFAFAILSLLFTVKVPVSSHFLAPTDRAKTQSRGITGFIMIINLLVYGIIMNWRKGGNFHTIIRIALIGMALFFNTFLLQVTYILVRDGTFF